MGAVQDAGPYLTQILRRRQQGEDKEMSTAQPILATPAPQPRLPRACHTASHGTAAVEKPKPAQRG